MTDRKKQGRGSRIQPREPAPQEIDMNSGMTMLGTIEAIARRAGAAIMEVYRSAGGMEVRYKEDDSPLTEADRQANAIISEALEKLEPRLPVLSEESMLPDFAERGQWRSYWLVDPLDGTREFVKRNGEFTVNIARVSGGVAELGVVHVPVSGTSYLGDTASGAFCQKTGELPVPIQVRKISEPGLDDSRRELLKIVASRSHLDSHLGSLRKRLEAEFGEVELVNIGSSLKICLIAEGKADIYPRLAPTSEWDTAAAHAVLTAAGGEITDTRFAPLRYNSKEGLLNPHFLAVGDRSQQWRKILGAIFDPAAAN